MLSSRVTWCWRLLRLRTLISQTHIDSWAKIPRRGVLSRAVLSTRHICFQLLTFGSPWLLSRIHNVHSPWSTFQRRVSCSIRSETMSCSSPVKKGADWISFAVQPGTTRRKIPEKIGWKPVRFTPLSLNQEVYAISSSARGVMKSWGVFTWTLLSWTPPLWLLEAAGGTTAFGNQLLRHQCHFCSSRRAAAVKAVKTNHFQFNLNKALNTNSKDSKTQQIPSYFRAFLQLQA